MKGEIEIKYARDLIESVFGVINFIEESHQYFIDEKEYTPVSHIIHEYEPYVDWDEKADAYARKYGRSKSDVQKEWKLNNLKSTISGTRTHEFGESYTWLKAGFPDRICTQNKPQYIEEYNTLVSTYPKEDAVKKFYEELDDNIKPIGAEFKLSTEFIKGARRVCGTCDILFWDDNLKGYVIGDWKTNKSLVKEYARKWNITMEKPFDNLIDEPFSHYILQFNLYRRMLESIGLKIVGMRLIWLQDDGDYTVYDIDKIDDNIIDSVIKQKGEN